MAYGPGTNSGSPSTPTSWTLPNGNVVSIGSPGPFGIGVTSPVYAYVKAPDGTQLNSSFLGNQNLDANERVDVSFVQLAGGGFALQISGALTPPPAHTWIYDQNGNYLGGDNVNGVSAAVGDGSLFQITGTTGALTADWLSGAGVASTPFTISPISGTLLSYGAASLTNGNVLVGWADHSGVYLTQIAAGASVPTSTVTVATGDLLVTTGNFGKSFGPKILSLESGGVLVGWFDSATGTAHVNTYAADGHTIVTSYTSQIVGSLNALYFSQLDDGHIVMALQGRSGGTPVDVLLQGFAADGRLDGSTFDATTSGVPKVVAGTVVPGESLVALNSLSGAQFAIYFYSSDGSNNYAQYFDAKSYVAGAGPETIVGGTLNNVIYAKPTDAVDGGGGFNWLVETGSYATLQLGSPSAAHIQSLVLGGGTNTVTVAAGDTDFVYLYGGDVGSNNNLTLGSGGGYEIATGGFNSMHGGSNAAATDVFVGGVGHSSMQGGAGANFYYIGQSDSVTGAGVYNTAVLVAGNVALTNGGNISDVQQVILNGGTNFVDMTGSTDFVYLFGGAGTNTMTLGAGGGYELSTGGVNHMFGGTSGTGTDVFVGGVGTNDMHGGSGNNLYYAGSNDSVFGSTAAGAYNTLLELSPGVSLELGGANLQNVQQFIFYAGNNTLDASSATSQVIVYGGSGNDTITGGSGNDFLWGGGGGNTFIEKQGWGQDTIVDWGAGSGNTLDLTALSALGVHGIADLTQTISGGNLVITSSHTGANSITLDSVTMPLTAVSLHFA